MKRAECDEEKYFHLFKATLVHMHCAVHRGVRKKKERPNKSNNNNNNKSNGEGDVSNM